MTNNLDIILKFASSYENPFEYILNKLNEIDNTKDKGDLFELLCKKILINNNDKYKFTNVWLLNEIPDEIRKKLNLSTKDYGIDIICENNNLYYAIQCKYRKRYDKDSTIVTKKPTINTNNNINSFNVADKIKVPLNRVSWKELSTFYSLVERTGPFEKYIIMTTANTVNRQGKKSEKDITLNYNYFNKKNKFFWLSLISQGNKLDDKQDDKHDDDKQDNKQNDKQDDKQDDDKPDDKQDEKQDDNLDDKIIKNKKKAIKKRKDKIINTNNENNILNISNNKSDDNNNSNNNTNNNNDNNNTFNNTKINISDELNIKDTDDEKTIMRKKRALYFENLLKKNEK